MSRHPLRHPISMLALLVLTGCAFLRPRFDVSVQYTGNGSIEDVEVLIEHLPINFGNLSLDLPTTEGRITVHGSLPKKITVTWKSSQGVDWQREITLGNEVRSRLNRGVLKISIDDSGHVRLAVN